MLCGEEEFLWEEAAEAEAGAALVPAAAEGADSVPAVEALRGAEGLPARRGEAEDLAAGQG